VARVSLSFDNGPSAETPRVLDILARHGALASFFVIGQALESAEHRAHARRAREAGHWIGNHTHTHATPLGLLGPEASRAEITRAQKALGDLAHPDRLFRPTGGGGHLDRRLLSPAARDWLIEGGYTCVLWNAVPRDWDDQDGWGRRALAAIATLDHALVVLHDIPGACADGLDEFLTRLLGAGHAIIQDFPSPCVPLRRGDVTGDLDRYVTE
jgi:peptidoglycan/xylan/chitin deacetylase (PgdA/CDA1 family)